MLKKLSLVIFFFFAHWSLAAPVVELRSFLPSVMSTAQAADANGPSFTAEDAGRMAGCEDAVGTLKGRRKDCKSETYKDDKWGFYNLDAWTGWIAVIAVSISSILLVECWYDDQQGCGLSTAAAAAGGLLVLVAELAAFWHTTNLVGSIEYRPDKMAELIEKCANGEASKSEAEAGALAQTDGTHTNACDQYEAIRAQKESYEYILQGLQWKLNLLNLGLTAYSAALMIELAGFGKRIFDTVSNCSQEGVIAGIATAAAAKGAAAVGVGAAATAAQCGPCASAATASCVRTQGDFWEDVAQVGKAFIKCHDSISEPQNDAIVEGEQAADEAQRTTMTTACQPCSETKANVEALEKQKDLQEKIEYEDNPTKINMLIRTHDGPAAEKLDKIGESAGQAIVRNILNIPQENRRYSKWDETERVQTLLRGASGKEAVRIFFNFIFPEANAIPGFGEEQSSADSGSGSQKGFIENEMTRKGLNGGQTGRLGQDKRGGFFQNPQVGNAVNLIGRVVNLLVAGPLVGTFFSIYFGLRQLIKCSLFNHELKRAILYGGLAGIIFGEAKLITEQAINDVNERIDILKKILEQGAVADTPVPQANLARSQSASSDSVRNFFASNKEIIPIGESSDESSPCPCGGTGQNDCLQSCHSAMVLPMSELNLPSMSDVMSDFAKAGEALTNGELTPGVTGALASFGRHAARIDETNKRLKARIKAGDPNLENSGVDIDALSARAVKALKTEISNGLAKSNINPWDLMAGSSPKLDENPTLRKILEKKSGGNAQFGNGFDGGYVDPFAEMDMNSDDGLESVDEFRERDITEPDFSGKEFVDNDINRDKVTNIWQLISVRYFKSAYPQFFERKKSAPSDDEKK